MFAAVGTWANRVIGGGAVSNSPRQPGDPEQVEHVGSQQHRIVQRNSSLRPGGSPATSANGNAHPQASPGSSAGLMQQPSTRSLLGTSVAQPARKSPMVPVAPSSSVPVQRDKSLKKAPIGTAASVPSLHGHLERMHQQQLRRHQEQQQQQLEAELAAQQLAQQQAQQQQAQQQQQGAQHMHMELSLGDQVARAVQIEGVHDESSSGGASLEEEPMPKHVRDDAQDVEMHLSALQQPGADGDAGRRRSTPLAGRGGSRARSSGGAPDGGGASPTGDGIERELSQMSVATIADAIGNATKEAVGPHVANMLDENMPRLLRILAENVNRSTRAIVSELLEPIHEDVRTVLLACDARGYVSHRTGGQDHRVRRIRSRKHEVEGQPPAPIPGMEVQTQVRWSPDSPLAMEAPPTPSKATASGAPKRRVSDDSEDLFPTSRWIVQGARPGKPIDHDELTFELMQIRELMSSFGNEAPVQSLGYRKRGGRCGAEPRRTTFLAKFLFSHHFERLTSIVILANVIFMGYAADHAVHNPTDQSTPAGDAFNIFFLIFYVIELSLKLSVHGCWFFINDQWTWNVLDTCLVVISLYDVLADMLAVDGSMSLTFLRILRLLRISKIFRAFRIMKEFKELRVMLSCIFSCASTLLWCILSLTVFIYIFAIVFTNATSSYLSEGSTEEAEARELKQYFGSVGKAMLTLYKVVTGGLLWQPVAEALKPAGTAFFWIFILYIAFTLLAVLNIVTGMFVQKAFQGGGEDLEETLDERVFEALDEEAQMIDSFARLFFVLCDAEHGKLHEKDSLSKQEFMEAIFRSPATRIQFSAMGLEVWDAGKFFDLLVKADPAGHRDLTRQGFVQGCMELRGPAPHMGAAMMAGSMSSLKREVRAVQQSVQQLQLALEADAEDAESP